MVGLEVQQKYVGGLKGESQMQLGRRVSGSCTDGWRQGEVVEEEEGEGEVEEEKE